MVDVRPGALAAHHVDEERRAHPQRDEQHLVAAPLLEPRSTSTPSVDAVPLDERLGIGRDEDDVVGSGQSHDGQPVIPVGARHRATSRVGRLERARCSDGHSPDLADLGDHQPGAVGVAVDLDGTAPVLADAPAPASPVGISPSSDVA